MRFQPSSADLIAAGLFATFMGLALFIADWPPPRGFVWLLPCALAVAVLARVRVPAYAVWAAARRPFRLARVLAEGCVAGLLLGVALGWLPDANAETGVPASGLREHLIWFAVQAVAGMLTAMSVYLLAARSGKRPRA